MDEDSPIFHTPEDSPPQAVSEPPASWGRLGFVVMLHADKSLVDEFVNWQAINHIVPVPGSDRRGAGWYDAIFELSATDQVTDWLKRNSNHQRHHGEGRRYGR